MFVLNIKLKFTWYLMQCSSVTIILKACSCHVKNSKCTFFENSWDCFHPTVAIYFYKLSFYASLSVLFVPLESVWWNKLEKWLKPGALGSWGRQTDRQSERAEGVKVGGWNRSFYMLSGFNLVRAIIHQFTEVANQMSASMCVCVCF